MRAAALGAVLALGLAACGGGTSDSDTGASGSGQAGGTYSVNLTEPSYLAPFSNCYESECSAVLKLINDPLVNVDPKSGELK